jgi:hypothetical protein
MTRALLLTLALMCENVNAAPQERSVQQNPALPAVVPAVAAPFALSHPLCQTGFTIAQRFDERNAAGAIIKSVWVRKCAKTPRVIYKRS